jgi:hypothetical protein
VAVVEGLRGIASPERCTVEGVTGALKHGEPLVEIDDRGGGMSGPALLKVRGKQHGCPHTGQRD